MNAEHRSTNSDTALENDLRVIERAIKGEVPKATAFLILDSWQHANWAESAEAVLHVVEIRRALMESDADDAERRLYSLRRHLLTVKDGVEGA